MNARASGMQIKFLDEKKQLIISYGFKKIETNNKELYKGNKRFDYSKDYVIKEKSTNEVIGTLIFDFIGNNFSIFELFEWFINKWGISGLYEYSETLQKNFDKTRSYTKKEHNLLLKKVWNEVKTKLPQVQKDFINAVTLYLYSEGPKWAENLNPLQRVAVSGFEVLVKYSHHLNVRFEVSPRTWWDKHNFDTFWNEQVRKEFSEVKKLTRHDLAEKYKNISFKTDFIYSSKDIAAICYIEFMQMLLTKPKIKVCRRCEQYFVPSRPNVKYCNRVYRIVDNQHYICYKTGPSREYSKGLVNKPALLEYNKAYNRMYQRITLQGKKKLSKKQFVTWADQALSKKQELIDGTLTPEEFNTWLKNWSPNEA